MFEPFPFSLEGFYESLCWLTERTDDDSFVILEDKESGKFVQFGRGPELVLDLPLAALNEEEAKRAYAFFRILGAEEPIELESPDWSNNGKMLSHKVLKYSFGRNAKAAAQAAVDLFSAVYGTIPHSRFRTREH